MKYPKINTIWKRDGDGKIIDRDYSKSEFDNIRMWEITEKVDGTNIRVEYTYTPVSGSKLEFKGRTDNAQIPEHLLEYLKKTFPIKKFEKQFRDVNKVILYGEGYGPKIQNGHKYRKDVSFIMFDAWINGWWLEHDKVKELGKEMGIDVVPSWGVMIDYNALQMIKNNPKSFVSKRETPLVVEGFVATSSPMVLFRDGTPVRWKIKVKDYEKV